MTITDPRILPQDPLPPGKREEFVKEWVALPNDKLQIFLSGKTTHERSIEASCLICDWNEIMHYIDDSTGICAYLSSFDGQYGGKPPYHIHNIPHLISLAAGIELDKEGLWEIASRNRNLVRAINVRRGLGRKDERPPEDHWKVRDHEFEQKLLDAYYKFKGWTMDGIPSKETLEGLGLDYVGEDFIQRGILTVSGGTLS